MTIGEKAAKIANNVSSVYAAGIKVGEIQGAKDGYTAGHNDATEKCAFTHFVQVMEGDGSSALQFSCPFKPDFLAVTGFDPKGLNHKACLTAYVADFASFGLGAGFYAAYTGTGGFNMTAMTPNGADAKYTYAEDGTVTLTNMKLSNNPVFFLAGMPYVIVAAKYTDKSLRDRIEEFVRSLEGSGTVTLHAKRVNEAFATEEWEALIAQKPDWTFTLSAI